MEETELAADELEELNLGPVPPARCCSWSKSEGFLILTMAFTSASRRASNSIFVCAHDTHAHNRKWHGESIKHTRKSGRSAQKAGKGGDTFTTRESATKHLDGCVPEANLLPDYSLWAALEVQGQELHKLVPHVLDEVQLG